MQSAYFNLWLCYFSRKAQKKKTFLAVLTWFLILGKIQYGGHDCYHGWWSHRPPATPPPIKFTSSGRDDQRLPTEGKIVSKYCNISKTPARGSTLPTSVCTTEGVWISVYVWGLIKFHAKGPWSFHCYSPFIIIGFFRSCLPKMSTTSAY